MSKLSPTFAEFAKLGAKAPAEVPPPPPEPTGLSLPSLPDLSDLPSLPDIDPNNLPNPVDFVELPELPEPDGLFVLLAPFILSSVGIAFIAFVREFNSNSNFRGTVSRAFALESSLDSPQPRKQSLLRKRNERRVSELRSQQALSSILRIGLPSITAAIVGFLLFDNISLYINSTLDIRTLYILSRDNFTGQFIQNFLIVIDLLFAILAGERQHQTRAHRSTTPKPSPSLSHLHPALSSSHLHRLRLHGALPTARGHLSGLIRRGRRRQIALRATDARRAGPAVVSLGVEVHG